jgi:protein MpaA
MVPEVLGYSVMHKPIELYTVGYGPQKVLILSAIHGNEPAGIPLTYRLIERLKTFPHLQSGYTVMIIPVVNPDGVALGTRFNASGVDLNRNFPADNRINSLSFGLDSLTEPESRILHDLITSRRPARIVSIHQPLNCLDYDGPGEPIAAAMATYCPLPLKKLGSRSGSLGSFCGVENNIPIITMELTESDSNLTENELWNMYGFALLAAISYPELPF